MDVTAVDVAGFAGRQPRARSTKDAFYACATEARVPDQAQLTEPYFHDNYWSHPQNLAHNEFDPGVPFGVAFAPSPFHVTYHVRAGSAEVTKDVPVQYRYVKDIYLGDKRMELSVVPAFSVRMSPGLAIIPAAHTAAEAKPVEREIHVTVTNGAKGSATATVALQAPSGWRVTPATASIDFTHEDEALSARFRVTAPATVKLGEYALKAVVTSTTTGTQTFSSGYQDIEYPHVQRRQVIKPATVSVKVIDVKTAPNLNVGYIVAATGPPAIEQLGARGQLHRCRRAGMGQPLK